MKIPQLLILPIILALKLDEIDFQRIAPTKFLFKINIYTQDVFRIFFESHSIVLPTDTRSGNYFKNIHRELNGYPKQLNALLHEFNSTEKGEVGNCVIDLLASFNMIMNFETFQYLEDIFIRETFTEQIHSWWSSFFVSKTLRAQNAEQVKVVLNYLQQISRNLLKCLNNERYNLYLHETTTRFFSPMSAVFGPAVCVTIGNVLQNGFDIHKIQVSSSDKSKKELNFLKKVLNSRDYSDNRSKTILLLLKFHSKEIQDNLKQAISAYKDNYPFSIWTMIKKLLFRKDASKSPEFAQFHQLLEGIGSLLKQSCEPLIPCTSFLVEDQIYLTHKRDMSYFWDYYATFYHNFSYDVAKAKKKCNDQKIRKEEAIKKFESNYGHWKDKHRQEFISRFPFPSQSSQATGNPISKSFLDKVTKQRSLKVITPGTKVKFLADAGSKEHDDLLSLEPQEKMAFVEPSFIHLPYSVSYDQLLPGSLCEFAPLNNVSVESETIHVMSSHSTTFI